MIVVIGLVAAGRGADPGQHVPDRGKLGLRNLRLVEHQKSLAAKLDELIAAQLAGRPPNVSVPRERPRMAYMSPFCPMAYLCVYA